MADDAHRTISILPSVFADWFAARGWRPRAHQLACLEAARQGHSHLLIAPTGGGKTLAGFLPSLIDIQKSGGGKNLHTLYISPLKALAVDIKRNVEAPVSDMALDIRLETRTGDTPASRRQRQKYNPPDILLTTPEQLALLLSHKDSAKFFAGLKSVILDELHALISVKRGLLCILALVAILETTARRQRR